MCRLALALALVGCNASDGGRPGMTSWLSAGSLGDDGTTGAPDLESSTTTADPEPGDSSMTGTSETSGSSESTSGSDETSGASESTSGSDETLPFDLDEVIWLHDDVSDWPVTIALAGVTVEGSTICMDHDISQADPPWPIAALDGETDVVANPWVFIEHEGAWYAATWEWLRPDQTCKNAASVAGDHIKQAPFDEASGWTAESGETYYFMVSGLARISGFDNVQQRSNIVELTWP